MRTFQNDINKKRAFVCLAFALTFFCAAVLIGTHDVNAKSSYYKGKGTSSSPYRISKEAELRHIAYKVNKGTTYKGKYFKLTKSIKLKKAWTPIGGTANGKGSAKYKFKGDFNGNKKTISGIKVSTKKGYAGLFGYNLGTIRNLTVKGSVKCVPSKTCDYIAGIAGFNAGKINNVHSYVSVTAKTSSRTITANYIGGIAGMNTSGKYVWNSSAGDKQLTVSGAAGMITKCDNHGKLVGERKMGGITGENAGTISRCFNKASVLSTFSASTKESSGSGGGFGNGYGGIAGRNGNNNTAYETGVIVNCFNTGTIGPYSGSDSRWYGGIAGFENDLSSISNCYTTGTIKEGHADWYPVTGRLDSQAVVMNTYSLDTLLGDSSEDVSPAESYFGIRKTSDEMKTEEFAALLGDAFGADTKSVNGGYPVLK